ncbi:MAG: hypothetical protein GX262_04100 [Clostridia bacterium]|nr:hypothetical protein [Clostridia bacterium]
MADQKALGRRRLFSLFANDLKYLGGTIIPAAALELAEIGTAEIDEEQCLAYRNQLCNACYSACPLEPKAIQLRAYRYPRISKERCNGCGDCVKACLAPIPAVTVSAPPLKAIISERTGSR